MKDHKRSCILLTLIFVLMFVFFSVIACSKNLSRDKAALLIKNYLSKSTEQFIPHESISFNKYDNSKNKHMIQVSSLGGQRAKSIAQALSKAGLISFSFEGTEDIWATKVEWYAVDFLKQGQPYILSPYKSNYSYDLNLRTHDIERVEVTGLSKGDNNQTQAVFTIEFKTNIVGQCFNINKNITKKGKAFLNLFDDGWRVEKVEIDE